MVSPHQSCIIVFPRSAIIIGGPASVMDWSDHRYSEFCKHCVDMCCSAGVFAFDGGEYFGRMEMIDDGWRWASTDENRSIFVSMIREVEYMLSLTVLPQPWKVQQEASGKTFLMVEPSAQDNFEDEVDIPPMDDAPMGLPEGWDPDGADTIMAEEEVIADFDVETEVEEIVEGLAPTGARGSSSSVAGLSPREALMIGFSAPFGGRPISLTFARPPRKTS